VESRAILFIIFFIVCEQISASCGTKKPILPFASHVITIFFDDAGVGATAEAWGAVGQELIKALEQQACPIICSVPLLHHVITGRTSVPHKESRNDVDECSRFEVMLQELLSVKSLQRQKYARSDIVDRAKAMYEQALHKGGMQAGNRSLLYIFKSPFNPDEWIIRKPNKFLYLLIPKHYLPVKSIYPITPMKSYCIGSKRITGAALITDAEFALGLKIDHMEIVPSKHMTAQYLLREKMQQVTNARLLDGLHHIFVTKSEYNRAQALQKHELITPCWTLYVTGSGPVKKHIKYRVKQIRRLFAFCNDVIVTKLLLYKSYDAALNMSCEIQEEYDYPITFGVAKPVDEVAIRLLFRPEMVDFQTHSLRLLIPMDFSLLVRAVTTNNTIDYEYTASYVMPRKQMREGPKMCRLN